MFSSEPLVWVSKINILLGQFITVQRLSQIPMKKGKKKEKKSQSHHKGLEDNEPRFALNDPTSPYAQEATPQTPTSCHPSEFLAVH